MNRDPEILTVSKETIIFKILHGQDVSIQINLLKKKKMTSITLNYSVLNILTFVKF